MLNKVIAGMLPLMPKRFVWIFSKRYIAGETLDDAIRVSKELNGQKIRVTLDILGEFITDLHQAEENKRQYLNLIDVIQQSGIDGNYSIKPTMHGLLIDKGICYKSIEEIVRKAAQYNNFVRIDMEDSNCTSLEIELFRKLKKEYPNHVGLVVQAYLKRTLDDLKGLMDLHTPKAPLNFRLCKGIYVESPAIAYKKYLEINHHFLEDLEFMFQNGIYPGIATHDKPLIEGALKLINQYHVPRDKYEFQMLYGVTPERRAAIVAQGCTMRVYVPFGREWFGYSTRRLKENPKMAGQIIKAIFIRK
jgi:proline dehydrogenase